jgi:formylglycine-generating enzyme required for sulfatase activity
LVQSELKKNTTPEKQPEEESEEAAETAPPPPPGCPNEMATIEAGEFMLGSNDSERNDLVELSARKRDGKKFCMDKYEYPNQRNVLPTRNISWSEANTACEKNRKRLCTEVEWERACKGPWSLVINQQFSYGNIWKDNTCNVKNFNSMMEEKTGEVSPSGEYQDCASNEGIYDLNGNVQEWTQSEGHTGGESQKKILKGGSYSSPKFQTRCSYSREEIPSLKQEDIGFRCCKDF